jgi:hypothetical protein
MSANFNDFAMIHHHNAISFPMVDRRCAMTSGSPLPSGIRPCCTFLFRLIVSGPGRFVEFSMGAFFSSARAIATRCFWPPESMTVLTYHGVAVRQA